MTMIAPSAGPTEARDHSIDRTVVVLCASVAIVFGVLLDFSPAQSLALTVCAIAVLLWPRERLSATVRTAVLGFLALVMLTSGTKDDVVRLLEGKVRVWNVYHYYLGAKYFPELGYQDLYVATLAADREDDRKWVPHVDKIRSLETYEVRGLTSEDLSYQPLAHFEPERWQDFKRDVQALSVHRSAKNWRNVFRDRGYNGTPLWTGLGRLLTAYVPASSPGLLVLCSLDLLLLAGTAWLFLRTFGGRLFVAALLLFVASPMNVARLAGGFLQTDWLCALVVGVCMLKRGRHGWAAAALGYATLTRVFPLVLVALALAPVMMDLVRRRTWRLDAVWRRFALVLVGTMLLGVSVGTFSNGRGLAGWSEFTSAISVHRTTHVLGDRRIGLEHTFTRSLASVPQETADSERVQHLSSQHPVYLTAALLLLMGTGLVVRTLSPAQALVLGVVPVFALTVLSRYYFGLLALMPIVGPGRRWPVVLQLLPFAAYHAITWSGVDHHTSYALLNGALGLYFLVVLSGLALTLPKSRSPLWKPEEHRREIGAI